jgi:lipopolysaccharide/colanic/teichoic acid biosynthesis glycosyltransferase
MRPSRRAAPDEQNVSWRKLGPRRRVVSSVSSSAIDQRAAPACADIDVEPISAPHHARWVVDVGCRALDILGAAIMLLALAPVLAAIAIAIRLDSPGPAIFRQQRVGRGRRPFTVMKFRTMHEGVAHDPHREFVIGLIKGETPAPEHASEESPGLYYKMIGDTRVTRVGRLLRRSSLDELPQLWNVLRGDMSLVGPRPPIPYEVEHYPPHWFARFDVKPGVTGLWQVSGRSQVTLEEMVRLDVDYARRRSLRLNLWILVRTVPAVLGARGAW